MKWHGEAVPAVLFGSALSTDHQDFLLTLMKPSHLPVGEYNIPSMKNKLNLKDL